jgi:hypothetical protein
MNVLGFITYAAFICALVALLFLVINFLRYRSKILADRSLKSRWLKAPFPLKSVASFAGSIAVAIAAAQFSKEIAHDDVLRELGAVTSDCRVFVAGRPAADPTRVLELLRSLRWVTAHHSSPSHSISIRLVCPSEDLDLTLSRDSSNSHEYWVFLPRYRVTSMNEIGRVSTDIFDSY